MITNNCRFWIGIDLGTSNSALFYIDREELTQQLHLFAIPQWIETGQWHSQKTLPSNFYILTAEEQQSQQYQLPWETHSSEHVVGEWAKLQQSRRPGRNISSVKSWLCYHSINPASKILPNSDLEDVTHYSPIEVTTAFLNHIKQGWNAHFAADNEEWSLENQEVVLTVPASFDEPAREYTVEAVRQAGIQNFTLLEEPQAAFYSWIASMGDAIHQMEDERVVLVVDIGGGTTDFSLVRIGMEEEKGRPQPQFERIAVSDHILLGGDNIDLALATLMEQRMTGGNRKLSPRMWEGLVAQCRVAKEALLSGKQEDFQISVAEAGSRLIGRTKTETLNENDVKEQVLEGFFPLVPWDSPPIQVRQHGLRQIGLPYAQEPAVTRHLCSFLRHYMEEHAKDALFPDHILFNGGSVLPSILQTRLQEQIEQWRLSAKVEGLSVGPESVKVLHATDMNLAVARGATYYQLARHGLGVQISGGSARSYYVGLMVQNAATNSVEEGWLCILPQQATVETPLPVSDVDFWLSINQPVQFRLISSTHRPHDQAGQIFHFTEATLDADFATMPPVHTLIGIDKRTLRKKAKEIQVQLKVKLNEIGTLSLFCVNEERSKEWKLEFRLRDDAPETNSGADEDTDLHSLPPLHEDIPEHWEAAKSIVQQRFGKRSRSQLKEEMRPFSIYKLLEAELGPRKEWSLNVLRHLWDLLYEGDSYRVRSSHHESNWIKLVGFCLRPGFGDSQDGWRVRQLEDLFLHGPHFKSESGIEVEWWIMCRRIAGGIPATIQQAMLDGLLRKMDSYSQKQKRRTVMPKKKSGKKQPVKSHADVPHSELWRLAASLEDIAPSTKIQLGQRLKKQIESNKMSGSEGWCLARLGARVPLYGNPVNVINATVVESWIDWLLSLKNPPFSHELPMILTRLGQYTGDRQRDISESHRQKILQYLKQQGESDALSSMLESNIDPSEERSNDPQAMNDWLYGDTLPTGLKVRVED